MVRFNGWEVLGPMNERKDDKIILIWVAFIVDLMGQGYHLKKDIVKNSQIIDKVSSYLHCI